MWSSGKIGRKDFGDLSCPHTPRLGFGVDNRPDFSGFVMALWVRLLVMRDKVDWLDKE